MLTLAGSRFRRLPRSLLHHPAEFAGWGPRAENRAGGDGPDQGRDQGPGWNPGVTWVTWMAARFSGWGRGAFCWPAGG